MSENETESEVGNPEVVLYAGPQGPSDWSDEPHSDDLLSEKVKEELHVDEEDEEDEGFFDRLRRRREP